MSDSPFPRSSGVPLGSRFLLRPAFASIFFFSLSRFPLCLSFASFKFGFFFSFSCVFLSYYSRFFSRFPLCLSFVLFRFSLFLRFYLRLSFASPFSSLSPSFFFRIPLVFQFLRFLPCPSFAPFAIFSFSPIPFLRITQAMFSSFPSKPSLLYYSDFAFSLSSVIFVRNSHFIFFSFSSKPIFLYYSTFGIFFSIRNESLFCITLVSSSSPFL